MDFPAIGGRITVNISDQSALFQAVSENLTQGKGFALATINLDHLVKLRTDRSFADAYRMHDLIVADGNPVVWMSRLAQSPVTLIPGSELVLPMAQLAAKSGIPIALLGSTQETLSKTSAVLQAMIPDLKVASCIAPPFGFDPQGALADEILKQVHASGAGVCFLALGAPKQETLAARGRTHTPSLGFVSIGAGLDFLAGSQKRAPKWVQNIAMEWLWRLLQNPKRLAGRYAQCFAILPGLSLDALRQRRTHN